MNVPLARRPHCVFYVLCAQCWAHKSKLYQALFGAILFVCTMLDGNRVRIRADRFNRID